MGRIIAAAILFPLCGLVLWMINMQVLAVLAFAFLPLAVIAFINLVRHEGYSVVIDPNGLELPHAPFRSSRRFAVPWKDVGGVFVSPSPPAPASTTCGTRPTSSRPSWLPSTSTS